MCMEVGSGREGGKGREGGAEESIYPIIPLYIIIMTERKTGEDVTV